MWGMCLILASFIIPSIGMGLIFLLTFAATKAEAGRVEQQIRQHQRIIADYNDQIARFEQQRKESTDEREREATWSMIEHLERAQDQEFRRFEREWLQHEASNKMMFLIGFYVVSVIGIILAIIGTVFGWRYLVLVRGQEQKPALFAGFFAALAQPLVHLVAGIGLLSHYIFQQGDWGTQQNFVTTLAGTIGSILGIALAVYIIYLTIRWVSGSSSLGKSRNGA